MAAGDSSRNLSASPWRNTAENRVAAEFTKMHIPLLSNTKPSLLGSFCCELREEISTHNLSHKDGLSTGKRKNSAQFGHNYAFFVIGPISNAQKMRTLRQTMQSESFRLLAF